MVSTFEGLSAWRMAKFSGAGMTGMKIIRAIVNGQRDPDVLAAMRDVRCKASIAMVKAAMVGNYQPEHLFALAQALSLYDFYPMRIGQCQAEIERTLAELNADKQCPAEPLHKPRHKTVQPNAVSFDTRQPFYQLTGVNLTQIHGIGLYLALRLVAECRTDLNKWPTAKHFTSWLTLAPGCKISDGKVLSAHTRSRLQHLRSQLGALLMTLFIVSTLPVT